MHYFRNKIKKKITERWGFHIQTPISTLLRWLGNHALDKFNVIFCAKEILGGDSILSFALPSPSSRSENVLAQLFLLTIFYCKGFDYIALFSFSGSLANELPLNGKRKPHDMEVIATGRFYVEIIFVIFLFQNRDRFENRNNDSRFYYNNLSMKNLLRVACLLYQD